MIVVGIDNGASTDKSKSDIDRADEFLPYSDVGFPGHRYPPDPSEPHGALYPDFLIKEVMPLIQRHYRVKTGPSNAVHDCAGAGYIAGRPSSEEPLLLGEN